jgi:GAF domain-containing protein
MINNIIRDRLREYKTIKRGQSNMNINISSDNNRRTDSIYPEDKKECYKLIHSQLKSLLENETHVIPNLGNTSALLNIALHDINWVGFYLINNGELLLGPFQGKPACIHISIGRGVCGTAVSQGKTQVIPDVHVFPGHIACDSESNSEIVIPIFVDNAVIGVLDIDSPILNRFDDIDREGLEEVVEILESGCNWICN